MTGEQREAIRIRLNEIEARNGGRLTPDAVVEDAKQKSSPLHNQFEWDTKKAAYSHWIEQARTLITSVKIIERTETTTVKSVYWIRDPSAAGTEQGYVSIKTLRSDKEAARAALVDAFSAAGDLLRRAKNLAVVLEMETEVDALLKGVRELRDRVSLQ